MDDKFEKIKKLEKELEQARKEVEAERKSKLRNLHKELEFDSIHELIDALKDVAGAKKKGPGGISPEIKRQIREDLKANKKGSAIARQYGVSVPTVHAIKQQLGLVKKRS